MKFIEEVYGIIGANGNYSCIYCEANLKKKWQKGDQNLIFKINRSLERAAQFYEKEKFGYINQSIMHIDFKNIVVDLLHMLLRMSEKLFDALLFIINANDFDSTSNDFEKRKNLEIFYKILINNCNITKPYYISSENKTEKINLKSLNGNEIEKIFDYFSKNSLKSLYSPLLSTFSKIREIEEFSDCFNNFYKLYLQIKTYNNVPYKKVDLKDLDRKLRDWMLEYVPFINTKESTIFPYAHVFVYHTKELLEIHGNINLFNLQGLEKLNSMQSKVYFGKSNRHRVDNEYIEQLVDNRNRTEFANLEGSFIDIDFGWGDGEVQSMELN